MAQIHLHVGSFNAGELSPFMGDRFAVEKVASGCRRLRNFIPHVHGPAFRRPGMQFIAASAGNGFKSSLRSFNFSTSTGFILEFHPGCLRVFSNGVHVPLVNSVILPYSETECAELQIAQVNDVVYIAHPSHPPRKLVRYQDDDWRLEEIAWDWPAMGDENTRLDDTNAIINSIDYPTCEWPEFAMPAGDVTVTVINPHLSGLYGDYTVSLYYWSGAAWVEVAAAALAWQTVAPAPVTATVGTQTAWRIVIGGAFDADTYVDSECRIKVTWATGAYVLNVSDGWPPRRRGATLTGGYVKTGDVQPYVVCGEAVPAGATLKFQHFNLGWITDETLTMVANTTVVGAVVTAAGEKYRMLWEGRAMTKGGILSLCGFTNLVSPTVADVTIAADATSGLGVGLTASAALFEAGHVGGYFQITHRRELGTVDIVAAVPVISAAESDTLVINGKWEVFTYGTWDATLFLERMIGATWETVRTWVSNSDRNVIADGEAANGSKMRLRVTAGTSAAASGAAVPRFVLESADARVDGIVKITSVAGSTAATADVIVPLYSTTATSLWTEGAWSDANGFPRTVALHGQRLWFGGTESEPMRLWGSVVNDYENFRRTSFDDAGVSFVPASQQSNRMQWLVSHGENLVLGSNGDEWTLSGGTEQGPITPTSVNVKRRSGYGSLYLPALILGDVAVFAQRGGRRLRSAAPRQEGLTWAATDLTVLAEHLTEGGIVQFALMMFPQTILWAVTGDGRLIGMTFEQEQNVFAWHQHSTEGLIESVAVVSGTGTDEVWLAVNRGGMRQIERFDSSVMARDFDAPARLLYLDSAIIVENDPASATLSGLDHLEGISVTIFANGNETTATVSGGEVTLAEEVELAVVGLPFTSELQPMRIELPLRDGSAQHRLWRISRVGIYLHESLGGEVADSPASRFEKLNYREIDTPMDSPPPLFSGERETALESRARAGADVIVRTSGASPLNVGSITLKGDIYGE